MKWTGWSSEVVPQMRTIDFEQDTRLVQYEGKSDSCNKLDEIPTSLPK